MDEETLAKLKSLKWSKYCSKYSKWITYSANDGTFSYEFTKRTLYIYDVEDSDGDNPYYKASGEKLRRRLTLTADQTAELQSAVIESTSTRTTYPSSSNSDSDSD